MSLATARPVDPRIVVRFEGDILIKELETVRGNVHTLRRVKICPKGIIRRSEISWEV